jgi:NAD(P)-dependent dehydrogenase (short-subunit alcohol dehydrogenase family)
MAVIDGGKLCFLKLWRLGVRPARRTSFRPGEWKEITHDKSGRHKVPHNLTLYQCNPAHALMPAARCGITCRFSFADHATIPMTRCPDGPTLYNACVILKGKTVLITGGARRLGKAIALAMAGAGANVAFTYLSSVAEAARTLDQLRALSPDSEAFLCDLRHEDQVQQMVAEVLDCFSSIDILVNNAGLFQTTKLEEISAAQWDDLFAVNVRAPFLVSKYCIPALRGTRGKIINLGSLGGSRPWTTHAHYCSSKAALHMLTQVMAKGLAPEIAVNCVAPGMIDTGTEEKDPALLRRLAGRTPMKTNGTVQDVVNAVMYFATAPHFITGQILTADGGLGLA